MLEFLQNLFISTPFIPHGHCYLWKPGLVWLHITSDSLIALAYYSIPITIVYFVQKRGDFPFKSLLLLFGAFIISCGTTHIIEIWTLWHPIYWLSGALKAFTAGISVYTAAVMVPLVPKALALPSPAQLEAANHKLEAELIERKRIEEKLRSQEQMVKVVMENIPQLIFWKDKNSVYLGCNRSFAVAAGIGDPENIVGKTDYDLACKHEEADFFRECDARVMETDIAEYHIIEPALLADGKQAWMDANKIPLHDPDGKVVGILATVEDITERKQAEEELRKSRERFELAVLGSRDGLWDWELETNEVYFSPRWKNMLGFEDGELQNNWDEWKKRIHPDDSDRVLADVQACLDGLTPYSEAEYRLLHKDGGYRWVLGRGAALFDANGRAIRMAGSHTDITGRKRTEEAMKKAKEELEFSYSLVSAVIEGTPDPIYVKDLQGRYLMMNSAAAAVFGRPEGKILGLDDTELLPTDLARQVMETDQYIMTTGEPQTIEEVVPSLDATRTYLATKSVYRDPKGNAIGLIGVARDITQRKQVEDALQEQLHFLQVLIDTIPAPIFYKNHQGVYLGCNGAFETYLGLTKEQIVGKSAYDIAPKHLAEKYHKADMALFEERGIQNYESSVAYADGTQHDVVFYKATFLKTDNTIGGLVGIILDISDRKQAELALKKAKEELEIRVEERTVELRQANEQLQSEIAERIDAVEALRTTNQTLQTLIQTSPLAIATLNSAGNVTMWNSAAEKLFGWSQQEVLGKPLPIIPLDQKSELRATLNAELQGKEHAGLELRRQRKDGSLVDVALWTAPLFDGSDVAIGSMGLFIDIRDRIGAEAALRESQQQLQALIDYSPAIIYVKDTQGRYTLINRRWTTLFHLQLEEVKGKTDFDLFPHEFAQAFRANDLKVIQSRTSLEIEEVVFQDDGLHTYISIKFPLYDAAGVPSGICGISTDISDRKRAEEEKQKFVSLIENSNDFIGFSSLNGEPIFLNEAGRRLVGLDSLEETHSKKLSEFFPSEVLATFQDVVLPTVMQQGMWEGETQLQHFKTGELIDVYKTIFTIKHPQTEEPSYLATVTRDITERKRAEVTLQESERRFRAIFNSTFQLMALLAPSGTVEEVNQTALDFVGWEKADVIGRSFWEDPWWRNLERTTETETRNRVKAAIALAAAGEFVRYEVEVLGRTDKLLTIDFSLKPIFDENGQVVLLIAEARDISDRQQAEEALQQSEQRYRSLVVATSQLIWTTDGQGQVVDIPVWRTYTGQTPEEVKGYGWIDALHPDDREQSLAIWTKAVKNKSLYKDEYRIRRADGNYRYFSVRGIPLLASDGSICEWIGACTDIHDRKAVEEAIRQSEARYRSLVVATSQIVWLNNAEGMAVDMPEWGAYTGQTPQEIAGWGWLDAVHPEDRQHTAEIWNRCVETKSLYEVEYRIRGKDGNYRFFAVRGVPVLGQDGSICEWIGICTDIHERKQAEAALRETAAELVRSEAELKHKTGILQLVLNSMGEGVIVADETGKFLLYNPAAVQMFGLGGPDIAPEQWSTEYGLFLSDGVTPYPPADLPLARAIRGEGVDDAEMFTRPPSTREGVWLKINGRQLNDESGAFKGGVIVCRNVTGDKQAEKRLKQLTEELKEQVQRANLMNRLAQQIRNSLDFDTIVETSVQEIRYLLQSDRCTFSWCHNKTDLPYWEVIKDARHPDLPCVMGVRTPVTNFGSVGDRTLYSQMMKLDDVSTLTNPEGRKEMSSSGVASLLSLPVQTKSGQLGTICCIRMGEPRPWSDSEVELLGNVADQLAIAISQAELYAASREATNAAQLQAIELEQTLQQLQRTQAQLVQTEKMSSLGQLVAGVAHEINNPVNFIYGNINHANDYAVDLLDLVQLYQKYYPTPDPEIAEEMEAIDLDFIKQDLPKILSSMKMGAERIRNIVLSLRNFSRLDESEMKQVDIHEGIDSTLLILQNRLKAKPDHPAIEVIKEYGQLPQVYCYAGQLNQVFMNILTNSIDALDERNKKQTSSSASPGAVADLKNNPSTIRIRTEALDSRRLLVSIADNGPGMTEEVQRRLFDPFFTTKPVGAGTGLGMSISYQIVEKHGGQLTCISAPERGAEFLIEIPISHQNSKFLLGK